MDEIKYHGYSIGIEQDETALDPRDDDNMGTMVCFHNRYNLGDQNHGFDRDEFISYLTKNKENIIVLPLKLYDHSGITMSVSNNYPYNDGWDSMQVGFIFVTKEKIRKEFDTKIVTKAIHEKVISNLKSEVELYDNYLTGAVYCYVVKDNEGNVIDSCGGFYGYDHKRNGLIEYAKDFIDCEIKSKREKYFKRIKQWIHSKVNLQYRTPFSV